MPLPSQTAVLKHGTPSAPESRPGYTALTIRDWGTRTSVGVHEQCLRTSRNTFCGLMQCSVHCCSALARSNFDRQGCMGKNVLMKTHLLEEVCSTQHACRNMPVLNKAPKHTSPPDSGCESPVSSAGNSFQTCSLRHSAVLKFPNRDGISFHEQLKTASTRPPSLRCSQRPKYCRR